MIFRGAPQQVRSSLRRASRRETKGSPVIAEEKRGGERRKVDERGGRRRKDGERRQKRLRGKIMYRGEHARLHNGLRRGRAGKIVVLAAGQQPGQSSSFRCPARYNNATRSGVERRGEASARLLGCLRNSAGFPEIRVALGCRSTRVYEAIRQIHADRCAREHVERRSIAASRGSSRVKPLSNVARARGTRRGY